MTHITIEKEKLEQVLGALEKSQGFVEASANAKLKDGWGEQLDEADKAIATIKEVLAKPEQEPVAAAKKDEVLAASIEFIGALTGMTPPPIEVAPPEVFKPFRDFTEKVCSILATQPNRKPLTDKQIDNATRKQVDALLDHMYEHGTAEEGIDFRVRAIARAIEAAHGIHPTGFKE